MLRAGLHERGAAARVTAQGSKAENDCDLRRATVDSMYRALAGVWFALACAAMFAMGLGRLFSLVASTPAAGNSTGAMIAELLLPLLLVFWKRRMATASAASRLEEMAA